jgi:acyl-CoA reductase-like NAD-dependent aldehyde dehydrogenase
MSDGIFRVPNWINGRVAEPHSGHWLDKFNPHTGKLMCRLADSETQDAQLAVTAAYNAFEAWSEWTPVKRGQILNDLVFGMKANRDELAECVAVETGKPIRDAEAEVKGAISQGEFFAGEGMRLYGRSLTSGMEGKQSFTVRQARGVAGLIVPANTPIANIAWKLFPALICGNTVVLKASEDAPQIALRMAELARDAGIPSGVINVIQGRGNPAGSALVEDPQVALISFTGSTEAGRWIAGVAGKRLARISLELGGKNPFVVCDDADLDKAVSWATLSAFSNAGQRCAAGSRLIVMKNIYDLFRERFVARAARLKLGVDAGSDLGPVINLKQYRKVLAIIETAIANGGRVLCGGAPPTHPDLVGGYYINPTVIEAPCGSSELVSGEIFGPVATLHCANDLVEALRFANATEYGLTAAIHTQSLNRAMWFSKRVKAGVANINLGTFGSEPHMPFGGFGASGNGTREPGIEALDVYSELKNISILVSFPEANVI